MSVKLATGRSSPNATKRGTRTVSGLPARLTAIGYALAGSFEGALGAWRSPPGHDAPRHSERSEALLARVGSGALALHRLADETDEQRAIRGAAAVKGMLLRLLIIWAAVIAAMTLYGWSQ